jgi:hypothetical protein
MTRGKNYFNGSDLKETVNIKCKRSLFCRRDTVHLLPGYTALLSSYLPAYIALLSYYNNKVLLLQDKILFLHKKCIIFQHNQKGVKEYKLKVKLKITAKIDYYSQTILKLKPNHS